MIQAARRAWLGLGRWRGPVFASAWLLLCLLAGGLLTRTLSLDRWLDARHDWQATRFAPAPADRAAVTVAVDDDTVRRMGGWPLRRDAYVRAGDWLLGQGARAVVFGVLLVDQRDGDALFAQWLARAPAPVLLGARSLAADGAQQPAQPPTAGCVPLRQPAWQLPVWAGGAAAAPTLSIDRVGALSSPVDADGVLRRLPLWQQAGALALPAMPFAVWRVLHPELTQGMRCAPAGVDLAQLKLAGDRAWPLDEGHSLRPWLAQVPAQGAPAAWPLWQLDQAAAGGLPPAQVQALGAAVRGRVVFIGSSPQSTGEAVLTAQGWRDPLQLLAASFDALEQHQLLTPPSVQRSLSLLPLLLLPWLAASVAGWRSVRPSPVPVLLAVLAALLLLLGTDLALVAWAGQFSHIGWPLATLVLMAAPPLALWWRRALQARQALRQAGTEAVAVARAKTEFLAQVSHEVRTPLNALMGAAELLEATPLNDEQRRHVALFASAGNELLQMLDDLLDLSKSEAGLLRLQRHPFSLTQVVAQQLALFDARAAQKGLVLDTDTDPELPEVVLGDAQRVAQVLRNLLSNAVKFTPVGRVTLAMGFGRDRDHVRFEVRDTGVGVPSERLDQLFKPYTQAHDGPDRRYGGTGLGLAISRQLVELMGGQIGVHSREGLGSVFHVELELPATAAAPRELAFQPSTSRPNSDLAPLRAGGAGLQVLVADDSVLNLMLLRAFLEGAGYRVDTAVDGAAALRLFERGQYQLVMLDLSMPVMDGLAAVQSMRELEQRRQRPRTRILAVSGQVDALEVEAALAAGFDAHLAKPYTRAQLLGAAAGGSPSASGAASSSSSSTLGGDAGHAPASAANSSWLDAISRLPDSDPDEAVDRLGSAELYHRVLTAARDPLLNFEAQLDRLLAQRPPDLDSAHRLVHNLKSLAATLGLPGLAADAQVLERAVRDGAKPVGDAHLDRARARVALRLAGLRAALEGIDNPPGRRAAGAG